MTNLLDAAVHASLAAWLALPVALLILAGVSVRLEDRGKAPEEYGQVELQVGPLFGVSHNVSLLPGWLLGLTAQLFEQGFVLLEQLPAQFQ